MKKAGFLKSLLVGLFALSAMGLTSCANNENKNADSDSAMNAAGTTEKPSHAEADLSGTFPDTTVTGVVKFDADAEGGKVKMTLDITVPSRAGKSVAVHIHEHGDCGEMGKGAHGHWNPTNKEHGKWGSDNFHAGDIGNIDLDGDGKGHMELDTDLWTIGGGMNSILDKSIIVHSGVDDYKSQPAGESGNRIGCGVIKAKGM